MSAAAGLAASFMAKPKIDDIGSSCHVHLSVWDEDGEQSLVPGSGPNGVSEVFGHFLGGQVSHGRDLAVMLAPNINSYKRFGADVCEHLSNFFRQELEAFNHETVTDWELIRYFERV